MIRRELRVPLAFWVLLSALGLAVHAWLHPPGPAIFWLPLALGLADTLAAPLLLNSPRLAPWGFGLGAFSAGLGSVLMLWFALTSWSTPPPSGLVPLAGPVAGVPLLAVRTWIGVRILSRHRVGGAGRERGRCRRP
jgi:hypothetical protein